MIIRSTIRADLEDLSRLHAESLPTSLFTALGHEALLRYYAYVEASPREIGWTAAVDGNVVGACVLSYEPGSVLRRFVSHAPIAFAREDGSLVVRDADLRQRLVKKLREPTAEVHAPEVTQIFTDQTRRGHGIGAALLQACEEKLRTARISRYFVHTDRDDNTATIRFYRREGFHPIGESQSFGRAFLVMQKDL